jgi:sugar transferase (PEP-CTERM/EpsH1 system associated)
MARPIRILHVLHSFSAGGMENGIVNIINRSPEHLNHELCFLSKGGEFLQRLTRAIPYHELNKRPGNDIRAIFRLGEFFRSRKFDIVHTRNWGGLDGVMAACLTATPTVIHSEHGRDIEDPAGKNRKRILARRALAFRAKKFVAVSRDLLRWLELEVRIRTKKLVFIPNGVDTERFRPGRDSALRNTLGIANEEFVVGSVGRLDPVKNYEGLIEAARQLNREGHNVRLMIAGDGPERPRLERILRESPLTPRPLLLGQRADADHLYHVFDTFVLNSIAEGMSNVLLEAMASGLPIICTEVGGNVELVKHNHNGFLVPPNDSGALAAAIYQSMTSPDARKTYGESSRRFAVEHFSLERMIKQYAALYESVA